MARPYFGLRGHKLIRLMIITIVLPAYTLLGYNNAVVGGLLSLDSFVKQFPRIDTVNTTGAQAAENARIQGRCCFRSFAHHRGISSDLFGNRHCRRFIHGRMYGWFASLLQARRHTRTTSHNYNRKRSPHRRIHPSLLQLLSGSTYCGSLGIRIRFRIHHSNRSGLAIRVISCRT